MPKQRSDGEKFYDEVIAPKLREISQLCQEQHMPFIATVEYEPGGCGTMVAAVTPDAGQSVELIKLAIFAGGSLDKVVVGALRLADQGAFNLDGSVVVRLMKINIAENSDGGLFRKVERVTGVN